MRLLGIDYGSKRVGLALSDEAGQFAFPYQQITNNQKLITEIKKICEKEGVEQIVLGESLNYQGQANPVMKQIAKFKIELEQTTNLPVILEPEVLTSAAAERIQGKTSELDASAAALILESYLAKQR